MQSANQGSPLVLLALQKGEYSRNLMQIIGETGAAVYATESGRTAIRFCRAHQPQVVVIDEKLTDMTGFELCDNIRSDSVLVQQPAVILLSDNRDLQYRMRGFISGAQRCIFKTDNPEELLDAVALFSQKMRTHPGQETGRPRQRVNLHCVII